VADGGIGSLEAGIGEGGASAAVDLLNALKAYVAYKFNPYFLSLILELLHLSLSHETLNKNGPKQFKSEWPN
jgi:hypothetical protein